MKLSLSQPKFSQALSPWTSFEVLKMYPYVLPSCISLLKIIGLINNSINKIGFLDLDFSYTLDKVFYFNLVDKLKKQELVVPLV